MAIPFVHAPDLQPGQPETLSQRITRLIAPNPGPFTYTGSGAYLIATGEGCVVIDPGPDDEPHIEQLASLTDGQLTHILITHTHRDHCGGAARLKSLTGAEVLGHGPHPHAEREGAPALDEGGDYGFSPDHQLTDGEVLRFADATIEVIHTPGHIGNHLCFALEDERALFTGDHIMGWATTVVAPPDGDMGAYMKSLELLRTRQDEIYYPTHGAPITEPRPFVDAVKAHRMARDAAILQALTSGPRTIPEIVEAVYEGLNPALKIAAGLNVKAHLAEHLKAGRACEDDGVFSLAD